MSTELQSKQAFEDAIKERLRGSIGDLMPDEVLTGLIEKAIQEMFFTRRIQKRQYGGEDHFPSWFEEQVGELLKSRIATLLTDYFGKHEETLVAAVRDEIMRRAPEMLASFLINTLANKAHSIGFNMEQSIRSTLAASIQK
jgi:hypothetical protein